MPIQQVYKAEPYRTWNVGGGDTATGSFGDASGMLIRQYQFPFEFDSSLDRINSADSDRYILWPETKAGCDKASAYYKRINKDKPFNTWLTTAKDSSILTWLSYMNEFLKVPKWTGYRILITVNRATGYPVYTYGLFYKHPQSKTKVYTGSPAPNVLDHPRDHPHRKITRAQGKEYLYHHYGIAE